MQRDRNLVRLSRDHHTGLVLAKRARELATNDATERRAAWTQMQARFADELEPHFQLEERGLLPALRAAGEDVLVDRTLTEHAELRRLIASADPSAPQRFGEALTTHIRFEEAALFETAQRVLDADALDALGALHEQAAPPVCSALNRTAR
jgi:hemerythrin-like domain-containing protein